MTKLNNYSPNELALLFGICTIPNFRGRIQYFKENGIIKYQAALQKYVILDEQLKKQFDMKEKSQINFEEIATKMIQCYPSGRKPNTCSNWRGSKLEIINRLEKLYKLTNQQLNVDLIVDATKAYVKSFNGEYTYMRTLPYFIFKREIEDGSSIIKSDLISTIDALENSENLTLPQSIDWVSNLV